MTWRWKDDWSRVAAYALIVAFGAYSTIYPIVSLSKAAPSWAEILLGVEFVTAGSLLIFGMGRRKGYRIAGLVVVCLGLFTISGIIAIVGGTRVLSYAFLFAAFAMDNVHDIRLERRKKREEPEQLRRLLNELKELESARNGRTGP